ncbi:MAG: helix-turn-helix transcriptional regulator [Ruminococcus sp.]|nr:helix-turn-helix transcriptional regulator [Ruminococcus sp.]
MKKLRDLRKLHKLSQKELGSLVGLSESTISLYETGKREPDLATLKKLANYLNVTVDELLGAEQSILSNAEERETIREVHELSMINFEKMCDSLDEVTLGRIHSILISIRKLQDNTILSLADKQHLFECITALIGRVEIYADEIRYAPENARFDYKRHNERFINAEMETINEIVNIVVPLNIAIEV